MSVEISEQHEADGHQHRDVSGGWLRPAVFGAMDGLVTNVSLIAAGRRGRRRLAAPHRAHRAGRAGRGRVLHGDRGVRLGLVAERAGRGRGAQGAARAGAQRRGERLELAETFLRRGVEPDWPTRSRRRSRPTRSRRWTCTSARSSGWTTRSCRRRYTAAGASLVTFAVGRADPAAAVLGRYDSLAARPRSAWPRWPRSWAAGSWPGSPTGRSCAARCASWRWRAGRRPASRSRSAARSAPASR